MQAPDRIKEKHANVTNAPSTQFSEVAFHSFLLVVKINISIDKSASSSKSADTAIEAMGPNHLKALWPRAWVLVPTKESGNFLNTQHNEGIFATSCPSLGHIH